LGKTPKRVIWENIFMWQFVFWLCLGLVLYSYVGYPLALAIIGRFRRRTPETTADFAHPTLCLIISAFNEEKIIRKKIENSIGLDYPRELYSILVASDGSNDETASIAREYADHGVRLFHSEARSGKSAVLNEVVPHLSEDVVVFTDANAIFEKDALEKLVRNFSDPGVGCVVGKLKYVDRHTTSVGKGEGIYWKYESKLSRLESSIQSVLVANGSIFALRSRLFRNVHAAVANDLQLPIEIASQGYGVIYEPEAVAVECCAVFTHEEFQRKVRIVLRGLTGFTRMRDKVGGFRLWQFVSHKLIRWMAGPLLFVALLANAVLAETSAFFTVLLVGQLFFYLAAINGWRVRRTRKPTMIFYLPFYFTMVNVAAVFATVKFLTGERQSVWEKAESARFAPVANAAGQAAAEADIAPVAAPEKAAKT
jgi:cellulose synthase/poly-beta-1,6-N-acetylglucosamine synthase-like glycosyltransferase